MPSVSMLLKPASSKCNMRCEYCFYHDAAQRRACADMGFMSRSTADSAIRSAFEYAGLEPVSFAFQGGEPTLAGIDFFRDFTQRARTLNTRNVPVSYALQTNGLTLDADWIHFFADHHFLIGLSLDGPAQIHDANRRDAGGKGTFARVIHASQMLKSGGIDFNILCVLTKRTARSIGAVYAFYKRQGFRHLQFIPEFAPDGGGIAFDGGDLARALSTLAALWSRDILTGQAVSIRQFDNYASILLGGPPEQCGMCGRCVFQCVIEADGSVYPCDFYCADAHLCGNINDQSYAQIQKSTSTKRFLNRYRRMPRTCGDCRYAALCRGGCPRAHGADADAPFIPDPSGVYCTSQKSFFDASIGHIERAAAFLSKGPPR